MTLVGRHWQLWPRTAPARPVGLGERREAEEPHPGRPGADRDTAPSHRVFIMHSESANEEDEGHWQVAQAVENFEDSSRSLNASLPVTG